MVFKTKESGEFPGGSVVRTRCFHCWVQVQSLVGELRSCKPRSAARKKKKERKESDRKNENFPHGGKKGASNVACGFGGTPARSLGLDLTFKGIKQQWQEEVLVGLLTGSWEAVSFLLSQKRKLPVPMTWSLKLMQNISIVPEKNNLSSTQSLVCFLRDFKVPAG